MIHRRKKPSKYVQLDNRLLQDETLSWKAKGLLAYLLALPEDWQVNIADLTKRSTDGRDGTASGIKELVAAGYVFRERVTNRGRFEGYDYHVFEQPEYTEDWKTENGISVNGKSRNGKTVYGKTASTNNTYLQKTQKTKDTETKAKNEFSPDTSDEAAVYQVEIHEPPKRETIVLPMSVEKQTTSNGARRDVLQPGGNAADKLAQNWNTPEKARKMSADLGQELAEFFETEYGVKVVTVPSSEPIPDTLGRPKKTRRIDVPQPFPETADAFAHFSSPDKIAASWKRWLAYKKDQHRERYKTADSEITQLRQLWKRAGGNAEKAEQIIEQSIGNLWKGLFDLKTENANGTTKTTSNRDNVARQLVEIYANKRRAAEDQRGTLGATETGWQL